ncbi:hypothetical protein SLE2022_040770 [Rubroshorea leprosula]
MMLIDHMENEDSITFRGRRFIAKCIFNVLRIGPIPNHIAFIMDGNRRFAKKRNMAEGVGHEVGFQTLKSVIVFCLELGVKCVTAYAFSIDNFRRKPEEVQKLMDLMMEKMKHLTERESFVHQKQVRIHIAGNLQLLNPPLRDAAKRLMEVTAGYSKAVLTICIAYTSSNEIVHAVRESCEEKRNSIEDQTKDVSLDLADIEKHMYMAIVPDPEIVIRTSGENRLSDFLLWQSCSSQLVSTAALWPEIGFWHLVCAVLDFQRNHIYLGKKKKQM